ncbi:PIG-L deacetylase family protein [Ornithinibacillus halophilus]|uniref:N-acetylglucosaminyl deacetylase, LmbE family n=1 Tax=Ornithinibacillus halophilus TaxID=930117 RepID=A0A1M5LHN4_9BACI|nr:PIG-L deacetylase family protein [Ornithinibacillus halophilus]SHG64518.1 N-acetylglucosaminyl deacetylase, LmbE family [Ornithinibacillus halophilus]
MDVNALLAKPELKDCQKVLCIQPHPDDNEIGMGGVIAKLAKEGCEIHYLTVTDGRLGDAGSSYTPDQLAEVRKQEAEDAGRLLGAQKFYWLGHKDGSLNDVPSLAGEIAEIIRSEQYDTVFCPDPWLTYEAHYDHVVTGKASAQAAISCSLKSYPEGTKTNPCNLQAVGFYFTGNPNAIVDITDYFDLKFKAIAAHQTQMNEETLALYRTYFTLRGNQLTQNEDKIGEGLKMLRPIHLHCFPEALDIK